MRKIGLIINPHAKKSRRISGHVENLKNHFPDKNHLWCPKNLEELSTATKKILDDGIEVVFLSGGDGTFRATVQEFIRHKSSHKLPAFVLLQGGTGGLYSKYYYGSRHPLTHLKQALKKLETNDSLQTKSINILNVNGKYGFIFAIGGFSNVLNYYMSHKERSITLANWLIFRLTISFFLGTKFYKRMFPQFSTELRTGDTVRQMSATTISCSSLPVGYILNPHYDIQLNKSFAGLIFYRSPFRIFLHLSSLLKKRRIQSSDMEQFTSASINLLLRHPLQPMVDGDMLEPTTEINVNLGPQIDLLII
ncbi:MAG: diacylglycerol kinase family protein [Bdellovibrionota bacterium]